jgi:hypothetical protein
MNKTSLFAALKIFRKLTVTLSLSVMIIMPSVSSAGRIDEPPTPMAMIGDVLMRPVMAGVTLVGGGLFLATLPFSLPGGNAAQAGDVLFVKPFKATFLRCLGCTNANEGAFGGSQPVD